MVAQLSGMGTGGRTTRGLVRRLEPVEIGIERHLGIDDHRPASWHQHDHVGPSDAPVGDGGLLLDEVAVLHHARHLYDASQLHLAPSTPRLRSVQCGDEALGLAAKPLARGPQRCHLLEQAAVGTCPILLHLPEVLSILDEQRGDRVHGALEARVPHVKVAAQRCGCLVEALAGELSEPLGPRQDHLGGHVLDGGRERGALLFESCLCVSRPSSGHGELRGDPGASTGSAKGSERRTEETAEEQSHKECQQGHDSPSFSADPRARRCCVFRRGEI